MNKPNIILDLDQTLISSEPFESFDNKKHEKKTKLFKYKNMDDYYLVFERPGLQKFLKFLFKNFNVSVWTAATKDYALFIIENMILKNKKNRHLDYIFFSYHCDISKKLTKNSKDLSLLWKTYKLKGYSKNNTISDASISSSLGNKDFIKKAKRIRKVMGGGMRQAGYLAAAGIYALEHHIERLQEDHTHALMIEDALRAKPFVDQVLPVETNIVIASFHAPYTPQIFMEAMKKEDILMYQISPNQIRMVVHLDITPALIEKTIQAINKL
jgi:hypothetical protein